MNKITYGDTVDSFGGLTVSDLPATDAVAQVALAAVARAPHREAGWHMYDADAAPAELAQLTAFMRRCGFPVNPLASRAASSMLIEVHTAVAVSDDNPLQTCLSIHKDDGAGLNADVHTLLVYCTGSATGGELDIYGEDEPIAEALPSYTVDTRPAAGHVRAVLMSGRLWHCPRAITGAGAVRQVFVFQCERSPEREPERIISP